MIDNFGLIFINAHLVTLIKENIDSCNPITCQYSLRKDVKRDYFGLALDIKSWSEQINSIA